MPPHKARPTSEMPSMAMQLAEEDRVERHRGGEHLDDLVRFLLDQGRQQQGGEHERDR